MSVHPFRYRVSCVHPVTGAYDLVQHPSTDRERAIRTANRYQIRFNKLWNAQSELPPTYYVVEEEVVATKVRKVIYATSPRRVAGGPMPRQV